MSIFSCEPTDSRSQIPTTLWLEPHRDQKIGKPGKSVYTPISDEIGIARAEAPIPINLIRPKSISDRLVLDLRSKSIKLWRDPPILAWMNRSLPPFHPDVASHARTFCRY